MKMMYVYIMTNINNTVLYVGVTNHLIRRVMEHKAGKTASFTAKYRLCKLVYYEYGENREDAINREKYLKKCYRKTKIKIISNFNPDWQDLSYKIM